MDQEQSDEKSPLESGSTNTAQALSASYHSFLHGSVSRSIPSKTIESSSTQRASSRVISASKYNQNLPGRLHISKQSTPDPIHRPENNLLQQMAPSSSSLTSQRAHINQQAFGSNSASTHRARRLTNPINHTAGARDFTEVQINHARDPGTVTHPTPIIRPGKPVFKPIVRSGTTRKSQQAQKEKVVPLSKREETIKAISDALAAGLHRSDSPEPQSANSPQPCRLRMPFSDCPASPTSVYTFDDHHEGEADQDTGVAGPENLPNNQTERNMEVPNSSNRSLRHASSTGSINSLLRPGTEDQTKQNQATTARNISNSTDNIARAPEMRASISSLPELIRRATRLASNLDHGRTASRLGLNFFTKSEKSSQSDKRNTTYSEVLFSFPAPGMSTSSIQRQLQETAGRPTQEKTDGTPVADVPRRHKKQKQPDRRVCGLSLTLFIMLLVAVILIIAAAILLPIFLILVPKHNKTNIDSQTCRNSTPCGDGGISIVDNNACSCVCVDGYTGNRCQVAADPSCITATIQEGGVTYNNATIASDIVPLLISSITSFNISLNRSVLLSVFSQNNLTCSGENSLVDFTNDLRRKKERRYVKSHQNQDLVIKARQNNAITSSNSIVFQPAASSTSSTPNPTATASSSPTSIPAIKLEFAQVVVLYVLTTSRAPSIAVNAQQLLDQYLRGTGSSAGNSTVQVVYPSNSNGHGGMTADFEYFTISSGDGVVVGGIGSS